MQMREYSRTDRQRERLYASPPRCSLAQLQDRHGSRALGGTCFCPHLPAAATRESPHAKQREDVLPTTHEVDSAPETASSASAHAGSQCRSPQSATIAQSVALSQLYRFFLCSAIERLRLDVILQAPPSRASCAGDTCRTSALSTPSRQIAGCRSCPWR